MEQDKEKEKFYSNKSNKKIILASGSASRLEILKSMLILPDYIILPNVPEPIIKGEKPRDMSIRIVKAKAQKAWQMVQDDKKIDRNSIIIVGDTVACCGRHILDKAQTDDDVRNYLKKINGRTSRIYSSVYIIDVPTKKFAVKTVEARLKMKRLQPDEIDFYVSTKQGIGKAGGYAISGFAGCLVEKITGSHTTIIGLPALQVYNALKSFGYKFHTP